MIESRENGAPLPANEKERLAALRSYRILDSPPEAAFDRLTALAARLLQVPIAQVTFVDEHRQWFKSSYGRERGETPRHMSFCAHTVLQENLLIVTDATKDPRFVDNELVTGKPGIRAYAGAPITTSDGFNLGTVCAIDTVPRSFTQEQQDILRDLAAMASDELELRLAIEERTRSLNELDRSLKKLKATEAQRDDLTNMIIHDLRSPLTCVKGFIDALGVMAAPKLNPDEARCVSEARSGADRLNQMISTLLDVTRLETGKMPLHIGIYDVGQIARQAVANVSIVAKGRTLVCNVPPEPIMVECDQELIRRVLANLLINAVKFTTLDGSIHVRVRPESAAVSISVSDDGHGIPQDQHERIFEKFGQVDQGGAHRHSTGLGLTFCKLAVEAHGGTIAVQSEREKGATFSMMLPVSNAASNDMDGPLMIEDQNGFPGQKLDRGVDMDPQVAVAKGN